MRRARTLSPKMQPVRARVTAAGAVGHDPDFISRAAAPFPLNGSAARSATPNSRPRILSQSISLSLPLGSLLVVGRKAGATVFTRARISLRSELAGDPAEDCAESLGSIASIIGVRHPSRMESVDGKVWSEE
jgi:hypothetical protein